MAERSRDWMDQAEFDLKAAIDNCHAQNYEWACFIAQQAAEKSLKSLYQFFGGDAWGHGLEKLCQGLQEHKPVPSDILSHAKRLDRVYIVSRYPNGLAQGTP